VKIYTKTGDKGQTGLWGGQRVEKDSVRVIAYGNVDELNAILGMIRAQGVESSLDSMIECVQNELFVLGADLATPGEDPQIDRIGDNNILRLEQDIDELEEEVEPLRQFILPGGTMGAAQLHLARTVCRRTERSVVTLARYESLNQKTLLYLNRLSDWLFVLARVANKRAGVDDVPWQKPSSLVG
jgi:cob(I)alamin adenosyltransferase